MIQIQKKKILNILRLYKKDIQWLGYKWDSMHFSSDYFDSLYEYAVNLIENNFAYIDSSSAEKIKQERGTLTEPGVNSKDRDRSISDNIKLFEEMKQGKFTDGEYVLRLKIDMLSPNINMRDPVIYRIKKFKHHRTGNDWCIYPMYDFTHCISDAIENITHSLCTLEFEDHRDLYDWIIEKINHENKPQQIEFSRLALEHNLMSKRKLSELVEKNYVKGWDDPRMPTISGLRRRGYTPESIRKFVETVGVSRRDNTIDVSLLEFCIREDLNKKAARIMAVLDPVKLIIENYPEEKEEWLDAENNPEDKTAGYRNLPFSKVIYIERDDFMESPEKKYFRLSPGKEVRLRHAFNIICNKVIKSNDGKIIELECSFDPVSRDMKKGNKVKGMIHWVDANNCTDAIINIYDRLFTESNPLNLESFNENSLVIKKHAKLEKNIDLNNFEARYQFERVGYFIRDNKFLDQGIIYNKIVSLKDTWKKTKNKDAK